MPESVTHAPIQAVLLAATAEQEPLLANLLHLYIHDFSEYFFVELGADGKFSYPHLSLYWSEPGRYPFLVTIGTQPAGFAFVRWLDRGEIWDMAEFFILRGYRHHGVGTQIAHDLWRKFSGAWQVRVMNSNAAACVFWERAISAFTGKVVVPAETTVNGLLWRIYTFDSNRC